MVGYQGYPELWEGGREKRGIVCFPCYYPTAKWTAK